MPLPSLPVTAALCLSLAAAQEQDFKYQGEYLSESYGVQIVARGSGQFTAVILPGGLPGAGWTGQGRVEETGSLQGDKAVFTGTYGVAVAADGASLTLDPAGNDPALTLPKVARKSPSLDSAAPAGAVVLFDGSGVSEWSNAEMTADKLLKPQGSAATAGAVTKREFQGFFLHLEFREPFKPAASGLQRGNSGVYLQGRQELQILDSFGATLSYGADTMAAKRLCGAFWEYYPPLVNMSLPPRSWQTYDVEYRAAVYADGKVVEPAHASVRHNGVLIHDDRILAYPTLAGDPLGPDPGPLRFQGYGDSVLYRNIWVIERTGTSVRAPRIRPAGPVMERGGLWGADGRIYPAGRRLAPGFYVLRTPQASSRRYLAP